NSAKTCRAATSARSCARNCATKERSGRPSPAPVRGLPRTASVPQRGAVGIAGIRGAVQSAVPYLDGLDPAHGRLDGHVVAITAQQCQGIRADALFHPQLIRPPLVMETRLGDGL